MTFLPVFCPEGDPVALDDTFQYVVLSTLQWKDANLKVMIKAAKQRFAVLYNQPLEDRFAIETLEQAQSRRRRWHQYSPSYQEMKDEFRFLLAGMAP